MSENKQKARTVIRTTEMIQANTTEGDVIPPMEDAWTALVSKECVLLKEAEEIKTTEGMILEVTAPMIEQIRVLGTMQDILERMERLEDRHAMTRLEVIKRNNALKARVEELEGEHREALVRINSLEENYTPATESSEMSQDLQQADGEVREGLKVLTGKVKALETEDEQSKKLIKILNGRVESRAEGLDNLTESFRFFRREVGEKLYYQERKAPISEKIDNLTS
jgi:hypothetical protein